VRQAFFAVLFMMLCAAMITAQSAKPVFRVASIKPAASNCPCTISVLPGGVLRAVHVSLERLLQFAYRRPVGELRADLILDAPTWARTDKFDIEGQASDDATPEQIALMLQRLLEERFKLVAVTESRERDVYALRRKSSNVLGPDLRQNSGAACDAARAAGKPLQLSDASTGGGFWFGRPCATSDELARNVAAILQTDVVDETGLTGIWDYQATYPEDGAGSATGVYDLSMLPVALQRNLGLSLTKHHQAVSVLVIKSVARPTPN
jgi:uncharacterized protein (TIGR03435 family)